MQDVSANPLDYREGGALNRRREEISPVLDATDPDLSAFAARGGKLIVTIGTNDTLASPGAQLDYYQSVIDTMGREAVDAFARLFVIPQAGHGLTGAVYGTDGSGRPVSASPIASGYERFAVLVDWVERGVTPDKTLTVSTGERSDLTGRGPSDRTVSVVAPEVAVHRASRAQDHRADGAYQHQRDQHAPARS